MGEGHGVGIKRSLMTYSASISNEETCWLVRGRTSQSAKYSSNQCLGCVHSLPLSAYVNEDDFT